MKDEVFATAERVFCVRLPDDYRECARLCHGGQPTENAFAFDDPEIGRMESCLGVLLSFSQDDPENIFEAYESLRASLPGGAIPIADDGGGDFVCLDYGHGSPPSIGYWHHGENSLVPLASSFSGFLSMLYGESPEFQPGRTPPA
ncbi:MAG TPA: SMI1/KNR4 family protein [Thermoanaerobaculaceae bacterium]|nr:SMI1/KNR4 family protein [Thermoanaerobaculaceae bacterium]